uniref:Uncharacterized protein n=1 Tax=viral metagenome TaxID=1070528 RepID=A0A6M3L6V0_9ZZZZ
MTDYTTTDYPGQRDIGLEHMESMKVLGEPLTRVCQFKMRHFNRDRQEILDGLYALRTQFNLNPPDLVITHSIHDLHQDHQCLAQEVMRAFPDASILAWRFQFKWDNGGFRPSVYVSLENRHIEMKLKALACYETQASKPYFNGTLDLHKAQARIWGQHAGVRYAEAFECVRMVI